MVSLHRFLGAAAKTSADPYEFIDDIYRYAAAKTGSREDAEDIAIEVVHRAPKNLAREELKAYMVGIAKRRIADHYRKIRPDETRLQELQIPAMEEALDVHRTLGNLAENHRECLILKYVAGLSSAEIGDLMELKPEAVDSLLQRARKSFADEWEAMHGDDNGR